MRHTHRIGRALALLLWAAGGGTLAVSQTPADPAGSWKTIDDKTGRDRSIVRIDVVGGVLTGRIQRSLDPTDPTDPPGARCTKCEGARKDRPILGMALLSGLRSDGDGRHWSGGEIVDPDSGATYRAKLVLSPDGRTLEVRGFIGLSLFGRSQTWIRVP